MIPDSPNYNDLAKKLHMIIIKYCNFPDAIIKTQCKRVDKTPATITPADLEKLAPLIGRSVLNFTNPEKGEAAEKEIRQLRL